MNKKRSFVTVFIALILLGGKIHAQVRASSPGLALVGAKIYTSPYETPIQNGIVLIKEGKIEAVGTKTAIKIPTDAKVLDCEGLVITAGFWNCHVHFMEQKWEKAASLPAQVLNGQLKDMLTRFGFCYAFDLATVDLKNLMALRNRIKSGELDGPTIFSAGVPLTPENGSPFYIAPIKLPEMVTAEQARRFVKDQFQAGADAIKIWSASPNGKTIVSMPLPIVDAITSTAHKYKKLVFAHPTNLTGVAIAAKGGVDILAHVAPEDRQDWKPEILRLMLLHKMSLIPTLKLYKWDLERTGHSTENNMLLNTAVLQLHTYSKAGGLILFGTDVGFMNDYSPLEEYQLMTRAGLTFQQILASLTINPARRFGYEKQKGKLAAGMDADLVLLSADPASDIGNLIKVKYCIRSGRVIYK